MFLLSLSHSHLNQKWVKDRLSRTYMRYLFVSHIYVKFNITAKYDIKGTTYCHTKSLVGRVIEFIYTT